MIHYRAIWGRRFCIYPIPDGTTGAKLQYGGEEVHVQVEHFSNGACLLLDHWPGEPPMYDLDAILRFVPSRILAAVRVLRPADAC